MQIERRDDSSRLTKENILKHVTEYDIIHAFWPADRALKLNRVGLSPFRSEDTSSFIIGTKYGCITYKDMGALEYRGDVWKFVQQMEGLHSFPQVLAAIDRRFNLGYGNGQIIGGRVKVEWKQPEIVPVKPTELQVTTRAFTREELRYWNQYHQDISDLKREEIYVPKTIWRNRQLLPITIMTFCYYIPELQRWKLYRPHAQKKKNAPPWEWKWDNSIGSLTYIENLKSMENADVGILGKARKCRMVIAKATGIKAIGNLQAEDPSALTEEDAQWIERNVKRKICVMDSDKKGKEMSWWLTKQRGYTHCNTPDPLIPEITDMSDWAEKAGTLDVVTRHFQQKGII